MVYTYTPGRGGEHLDKPLADYRGIVGRGSFGSRDCLDPGKSTIANLVEKALHERGIHTMLLDGDNMRHGLNRDLGFTEIDRVENIRRVGEVAKLFVEAGLVVLCCFISPFQAEHQLVRDLVSDGDFVEIFIDVPIDECIRRDPQGLYQRALAGNGLSLMPFPAVLDLSGLLTSCFQLTLQMAMFI